MEHEHTPECLAALDTVASALIARVDARTAFVEASEAQVAAADAYYSAARDVDDKITAYNRAKCAEDAATSNHHALHSRYGGEWHATQLAARVLDDTTHSMRNARAELAKAQEVAADARAVLSETAAPVADADLAVTRTRKAWADAEQAYIAAAKACGHDAH